MWNSVRNGHFFESKTIKTCNSKVEQLNEPYVSVKSLVAKIFSNTKFVEDKDFLAFYAWNSNSTK